MAQILMYTHGPRAFASALVGHLYELTQEYSVVVLTDPLPATYRRMLDRRDLFPGLEAVVDVRALGFTLRELVAGNRRWLRTVRWALDTYQPSVVIGENDMSSLFDMYLMREASDRDIPTLTIQAMGQARDIDFRRLVRVWSAYRAEEAPSMLARGWRQLRSGMRRRLGDVLVHYLLPWCAGRKSLRGRSSYITYHGAPGMRDSRLHLVLSEAQRRIFLDCGVAAERLAILAHPAGRIPQEAFFPGLDGSAWGSLPVSGHVLVLLGSDGMGLSRTDSRLLSFETRRRIRQLAIQTACTELAGWAVAVKAHPMFGTASYVANYLGAVSANVTILDPAEAVEPLLPKSQVILDLPSASTSTLATAAAAFRETPVIAADLDGDLLGAVYRQWPGIDYVSSLDALAALLGSIASGSYAKREPSPALGPKSDVRVFATTNDAVRFVLRLPDSRSRRSIEGIEPGGVGGA